MSYLARALKVQAYLHRGKNLTEIFRGIFEKADAEVGACYIPGTIALIQEEHPKLWAEIQEAEDRINFEWLRVKEGIGDMRNFEEAVGKWKRLHLRAIRFLSLMEGHTGSHS